MLIWRRRFTRFSAQEADSLKKNFIWITCETMPRNRTKVLVATTTVLLALHISIGAVQAGDRNAREQANRDRERAQEEVRRAAERERENAKREAERQQEAAKKAAGRTNSEDAEPSDDEKSSAADAGPRSGQKGDAASNKEPASTELPGTVAELFRRWFKSDAKAPDVGAKPKERDDTGRARQAGGSRPDEAAPPGPGGAVQKARTNPAPRSGRGLPAETGLPAEGQRVEVLARRVTPAALSRVSALGFKAAPVAKLRNLDLSLTRLVAPDGMSAQTAKELLASTELGEFSFNRRYQIYRTAKGDQQPASRGNGDSERPSPMDTPCGTDRCYGPAIIGWRPELKTCAGDVRVGVIDTGIDSGHAAFRGRRVQVKRFADGPDRGTSREWHGTGVLALLTGTKDHETPGLLPSAQYLVADAFAADEAGLPVTDTMSLLKALDWLDAQRADIVNMSLAGPADELLRAAFDRLSGKGMIFVAAAGNDGPTAAPSYPAAYPNVIAVTAVDHAQKTYRYANRGDHIDVAAPGVRIWTAAPGEAHAYHSGTSFAAPFVTAAIAATLPGRAQRSKQSVLERLQYRDLGQPGRDPVYGRGMLLGPARCDGQPPIATSRVDGTSHGQWATREVLPWLAGAALTSD